MGLVCAVRHSIDPVRCCRLGRLLLVTIALLAPSPALAGMRMATGSYAGDGSDDRAITGVGFQPDFVIIKADVANYAQCRSSTMVGDMTKPMAGNTQGVQSNRIQSLDSDGFTVGSQGTVNQAGATFYWTAFAAEPGEMAAGSYMGDGADDRSLAGVGFQPDYVVVMAESNNAAVQRSSSMVGDVTIGFGADAPQADRIQALEADGFQLGTHVTVNKADKPYHYVAFKAIAGQIAVGSYSGDDLDGRDISGVGFQPEYVIIKADVAERGVHRPESVGAGDTALNFNARVSEADLIQALQTDGFQVGTASPVNQSGNTYYWMAFKGLEPTVNYRSIGTNTGTLYSTGNASVSSGSSTVTFAGGASLPWYIGAGDQLSMGGDTFYILSRDSATQVTIQGTSGSTHTSVAYTIKRAYNTMQAWEDDRDGDLVGENRCEVGVCYNDGTFAAGVTINGSTTDALRYMTLTVASGHRHNGTAGTGACIDAGGGLGDYFVRLQDDYSVLEWLEITNFKDNVGAIFTWGGREVALSNLLIHDFDVLAAAVEMYHGGTIRNSIFYDGDVAIFLNMTNEGQTGIVENCTVKTLYYGVKSWPGAYAVEIRNTIAVGSSISDIHLENDTIDYFGYNMYSTYTGFDPALYQGNNQSPPANLEDLFVSIAAGSEDLHLEWEGHDAAGAGLDLSADFTSDIDGETRSVPWDIGADRPGTVNHRSIGTNAATLYSTGDASITIGTTTVTFGGGASLPTNVGPGDELVIGAETFFMTSRDSATGATVDTAAVATHTSAGFTISRAFNTMQDWETDRDGDLVADDRREVGVVYNDGPFVFTASLDLTNSTTDAVRYMALTVAEGQRHDGTAGSGAVIDCDGGFGASAININNPYTKIEGFEIKNIAGGNYHAVVFYTSGANDSLGALASHLVVHDVQGYAVWFAETAGATMRNVIAYDCGKPALAANGSIAYVENCTFDNTGTGYGLTSYDPSTIHIRNTICVGASSWDINLNGNTIGSFGYNMYSTLTGFDPASYEGGNQTPPADLEDLFASTSEGSEDYHLEWEGHDAINNGLDLSASFTTDIDGQTWVAPWDIGADWVVPSGYRSIGTDAGTLYSTGTATINPNEMIVTFSGATLPANIGPGDELVIGAETFHLASRDSDTQVTVQVPAATTHAAEAYTISRAYNTLQAWEDDRDGDLVGEDRREIGVCYNDGIFTNPLTISGSTTDSSHYLTLTVAAGQRHNGIKDSGARIDAEGGWGDVDAITVEDEYTQIEWLEITDIYDGGDGIFFDDSPAADNGTVTGVFIHGFWQNNNAGVRVEADGITIRNFMSTGGTSAAITVESTGGVVIENCTLWGYTGSGHGLQAAGGSIVSVTNTISVAHDSGYDFYIGTGGGAVINYFGYNLFESTGGGFDPVDYDGNNQLPPQTLEHLFMDLSATDLHLEDSGHYAGNNGLDLSGTFTDDIDGTTRVDAWDIGADEGVTGTEELDPKVLTWTEIEPP